MTFKGEITADEDLLLKGRVEGSISRAPNVRIGEDGSLEGNIRAENITAEGTVNGDLHASACVIVEKSANIEGNIYSPTVSLIEGAHFKGCIDMGSADAAHKTPDAESPAAKSTSATDSGPTKAAVG